MIYFHKFIFNQLVNEINAASSHLLSLPSKHIDLMVVHRLHSASIGSASLIGETGAGTTDNEDKGRVDQNSVRASKYIQTFLCVLT